MATQDTYSGAVDLVAEAPALTTSERRYGLLGRFERST